jgi:hypothetical protein
VSAARAFAARAYVRPIGVIAPAPVKGMRLQANYFVEPINAWLPPASAQKFSHMLLASHLGADWRRIF